MSDDNLTFLRGTPDRVPLNGDAIQARLASYREMRRTHAPPRNETSPVRLAARMEYLAQQYDDQADNLREYAHDLRAGAVSRNEATIPHGWVGHGAQGAPFPSQALRGIEPGRALALVAQIDLAGQSPAALRSLARAVRGIVADLHGEIGSRMDNIGELMERVHMGDELRGQIAAALNPVTGPRSAGEERWEHDDRDRQSLA